jgi:hypothetical protein
MLIKHPGIISPIYDLIKTIEFEIEIGDDQFSMRIELFRCVSEPNRFRARLGRFERFRIQSTFPQEPITHQPAHSPSDEEILIDSRIWLTGNYDDFKANTPESAIQLILDDFKGFLVRTLGEGT